MPRPKGITRTEGITRTAIEAMIVAAEIFRHEDRDINERHIAALKRNIYQSAYENGEPPTLVAISYLWGQLKNCWW